MLRPSSPCFARSFPPRGSLWKRLTIFAEFCVEQNEARGSLTQGRLHIFAEENFATKNFQQARGRHEAADNFFSQNYFWQTIRKQAAPLIRLLSQTPSPQGEGFFVAKYLNSRKTARKQLTNAVFFAKIFSVSVRKRHFYALYADFCGLFSCFFMRNPEKTASSSSLSLIA